MKNPIDKLLSLSENRASFLQDIYVRLCQLLGTEESVHTSIQRYIAVLRKHPLIHPFYFNGRELTWYGEKRFKVCNHIIQLDIAGGMDRRPLFSNLMTIECLEVFSNIPPYIFGKTWREIDENLLKRFNEFCEFEKEAIRLDKELVEFMEIHNEKVEELEIKESKFHEQPFPY